MQLRDEALMQCAEARVVAVGRPPGLEGWEPIEAGGGGHGGRRWMVDVEEEEEQLDCSFVRGDLIVDC